MSLSRSLKIMILGCVLIAGGCDRQSEGPAQPRADETGKVPSGVLDRSHSGEPLPDIAAGEEFVLSARAGKPLLINLWATWCAPCIAELPTLEKIAARTNSELQVMTIAEDSSPPEKIASFLTDRGFVTLPAVIDPESELSFFYGTSTLPTTLLYGADGKEIWRYVGSKDWSDDHSAGLLAEAVQQ